MSEAGLLVSTRKGLLIGRSSNGRHEWEWSDLQRGGWIVDYSMFDSRSGKIWCAANQARMHRRAEEWRECRSLSVQTHCTVAAG